MKERKRAKEKERKGEAAEGMTRKRTFSPRRYPSSSTLIPRISFPLSGYCIENVMLKYACTRVGPMVRNLASSFALQRHVSGPGTRFFSFLVHADRGDVTSPSSRYRRLHRHLVTFSSLSSSFSASSKRNRHVCSVGGGAGPLRAVNSHSIGKVEERSSGPALLAVTRGSTGGG